MTPQLDDLDRKIVELLARDARVSNRQIAVRLGVTEGTIRGRIKRLEKDKCIRLTAVTSRGIPARRRSCSSACSSNAAL